MDKLTQELTFFLGYAVATFLTKTNRWTESIGFYSECLALWNKMSKRKPSPVMNLIERVIGEKVALGELFLFERGMKCYDLGEIKESINCFKKALPLYRQIGSKEREAWCRCRLGRSFHLAGQYETAMEHYKKVLSSIREISLHAMRQELQARVYNDIGEINHIRGRYEEAQMCYEKALKISIRLGKEEYQATSLNNLGVLNHNCLGKLHEALSFHEKALEIRRRLGCGREEGFSCNNIGGVYEALGDYEKALEYYRKSYKLSLEIKDKVLEGKNLYFIGKVHNILGQLQKAIEYHERALKIKLQTGVRTSGVLTDLGNHYLSLGDYEKASQYHKKAIKACEEIGDLEHLGICLNNACQVPLSLGEHEKAKSYLEKAIGVHESTGNKVNIVTTFCNISGVCRSAGQYQEAREYLEKALKISRETEHIQGKTAALYFMGSLNFSLGKYEQAIEYTEKALKIAKEISEKQREESCYALLGSVYFVRGQNERAIWYQNKALEMMKEIGKKDQSHINVLHNLGQTYSSQGNLSKACKTLLEGIEIHKSIRSSLKDETNKILLNDKNFPCYKSLSLLLLCERNFNQALLTLELGRSRALVDLMSKNYGINRNPAQNELTLNTLQSFLKEQKKNFLFIETFQTGCFALWFVDTGGSVKFKRVCVNASEEPGMDTSSLTLDDLQCEDRSLASLYGYDPFASLEQTLKPNKGSVKMLGIKQIGGKPYLTLSCMVKSYAALIAPIFDLIDSPEIIISPEPDLFLTPFASLKDDNGKYLSETLRVRLIPSLTTLKLIHDSPASYHSQSGALIVGDPAVGPIEINGCVKTLDPLHKAREEAQMVSRLVGVPCLIGEEATKEDVLRRIQEVSLVHIAAHGDEDTGEIALSPNRSVVGVPKKEDVILTMNEIAQVGIRAKLVVLSCCHSAHGKISKAEGVVGIARAFLGSGARSVLVSLWAVDDGATKTFMNIFYKFLIREKLSASESLHQTMQKMRESELYGDREHWAPFVLLGDDVTVTF